MSQLSWQQKVARGKRAARRPWNQTATKTEPGGATEELIKTKPDRANAHRAPSGRVE